jgi:hypothetical protein
MGTSQRPRKTDEPFRSGFSHGVMLFPSCAARSLRAGDVGAAVGDVHDAIGHAVAVPLGSSAVPRTGASRLETRACSNDPACVPLKNETAESARLPVLKSSTDLLSGPIDVLCWGTS